MSRNMEAFSDLVSLGRHRAQHQADRKAYTFLVDGDEEGASYDYAQLDLRARAIAARLQQIAEPGARVLLLYPPGLEVLAGFLGCLYAGLVAIPAPPPDGARLKRSLPRLQSIVDDSGASILCTTGNIDELIDKLGDRVPQFQRMQRLDTEALPSSLAEAWRMPDLRPDSLAYLQYTSGSTSAAKGVMISHRNVMANLAYNRQQWQYDDNSVAVTWMPYFHDYGLVEGLLQPLFSGIPSYVMSPLAFLRRPLRWLGAIAKYRATHSAAPNFGYDHCVQRANVKALAGLDLSSWRVASTGAEMVRIATLERFADTFSVYGFRPEAFFPSFGLAEATLLCTTKHRPELPPACLRVRARALEQGWVVAAGDSDEQASSVTLVGCGTVGPGGLHGSARIAIVDPETRRRRSADEVGEIWIGGPFIAEGYWQKPDLSEETFRARLADDPDAGTFLRTGDLGFLRDDELYIVSRIKDMIVIRGYNHYPQDIEVTVENAHPLLRTNCSAVFSVEADGEERLVVAAEVERGFRAQQLDELADAIRQAVLESHELQVYALRLLRRGTVPKTSSGKVQRRAAKDAFQKGTLDVVAELTERATEVRFPTGDLTATGPSENYTTLVELLQYQARRHPDRVAYTFLEDGEREGDRITYGELDRDARSLAALLQQLGQPGERALLVYPNGIEFLVAFFGSLYAGFTAVPAPPPEGIRLQRTLPRLEAIAKNAEPVVVLTTARILGMIDQFLAHSPALESARWIATNSLEADLSSQWQDLRVRPSNLAVLQYTSGSTGTPRGVMVSHRKILRHCAFIASGLGYDETSVELTWVPNFHDYGLMEGLLQPMYQGSQGLIMAPQDFIQHPDRWLRALSKFRVTNSGGPNFAYELALARTRPEQLEGIDLSGIRSLINAAEPVHAETMKRFYERFKDHGLRWQALFPAFGLAEATLVVTGKGPQADGPILTHVEVEPLEKEGRIVEADEPSDSTRTFVGCGRPVLNTKVVIVDAETQTRRGDDRVGEIWVSSSSIPRGYWRNAGATAETFQAYLEDTGEGPFLRTGDLGFLRHGELHITGRLKDLIIIRGQNYYPSDIEWTLEHSHQNLRPGCSAAFSVEAGGEERLVVMAEVRRWQEESGERVDLDPVIQAIREEVVATHGVEVFAVELIKARELIKTSSGKIARAACKRAFLEGTADMVQRWTQAFESVRRQSQEEQRELLQRLEQAAADDAARAEASQPASGSEAQIRAWLVQRLAALLQVDAAAIDVTAPFARYGMDSARSVSLSGELEDWLSRRLPTTLLYQYPTVEALSRHLAGGDAVTAAASRVAVRASQHEPVAIVGVGCRFPGATGPDAYWRLLSEGVDAISEVPAERWDLERLYNADLQPGKMTTRWGGFLDDVAGFDAYFFGISPREAVRVDPQQRLLLEVAWEALENAGLAADRLAGSDASVFVGISLSDYGLLQLSAGRDRLNAYTGTGTALSIAANRLSYQLDFHGPSVAIDTACSSSLVAVHQAVQALRRGETSLALAGGVNLMLLPEWHITFSQAQMMAADGRCKTFDASADGYVRGEGCGLVVLKRLSDAHRDGDPILAVVAGSAVNQDGRSNGLSAPNGLAQQQVVLQALQDARVKPADIDYVEAHGTGTALGDPIEVQALGAVLSDERSPERPVLLGSAKTNIGHLESAAGIAGLIKVVLSLQHQKLPPHLHFRQPNPHIPWDDLPVRVTASGSGWTRGERRRVAGVSSFGFGGTNSHVIVAEAPASDARAQTPSSSPRPLQLLCLSARSEGALRKLAERYGRWLDGHPEASLVDVCYTAHTGRAALPYRLAVTAADAASMAAQLRAFADASSDPELTAGVQFAGPAPQEAPKVGFLLSGQGSQYAGMGAQLYATQADFRAAFDQAAELLGQAMSLPRSLADVVFDRGGNPNESGQLVTTANTDLLARTDVTQPALFALEWALAKLWASWGIEPDALLGHSVGEYVGASLAGALPIDDALPLIATRGRLFGALPAGGAMAAAFASEAQVKPVVEVYGERLAIAAVNGPASVTISGHADAVTQARQQLEAAGIETRPMSVSHAFHSVLLEPALDDFEQAARRLRVTPPNRLLVSNVSGDVFGAGELPDAAYWRRHARSPVRFADGVATLRRLGCDVLLEVGPHPALAGMAKRCLQAGEAVLLPSLKRKQDDWQIVLRSLGALFLHGVEIDWQGFHRHDQARRIALPTYAFEHQRYWLEALPANAFEARREAAAAATGSGSTVTDAAAAVRAESAAMGAPMQVPMQGTAVQEVAAADAKLELAPEDDVLRRYYQSLSASSTYSGEEGEAEAYLHFAPFLEPDPNFSWTVVLAEPDKHPIDAQRVRDNDEEMRRVMFCGVDFSRVRRVLDFGCGYGTDLIDLAKQHAHLHLDGFTISPEQVAIGRRRAERMGFSDRLRFFNCDSTKDEFPESYQLILGSQVLHHIREKQKALANISRHLEPGGLLVLAEVLSNVEGSIDHDESSAHFTPLSQWAEQLADHGLRLLEGVDVSREIGIFLDDPRFDEHMQRYAAEGMEEMKMAHLEGPQHLGKLLRKGLALYGLLTAQRDPFLDRDTLLRLNREAFARLVPYPKALVDLGAVAPEQAAAVVPAAAPVARAPEVAAILDATDEDERRTQVEGYLRTHVARVLELPPSQVEVATPFTQLGLDSLMGLELKKAIESDFNVVIPVVKFFEGVGVRQLTDELTRQLGEAAQAPAAPDAGALDASLEGQLGGQLGGHLDARSAENLAARVDQLSDEQVEALLGQLAKENN